MTFLSPATIRSSGLEQVDIFGRPITDEVTLFEAKLLSGKSPKLFDEEVGGAATSVHNAGVDASVTMSVAGVGEYVIRQSFARTNYQNRKAGKITCTGVLGAPVADTYSRIGYYNTDTTGAFDANPDGLWFEADGTEVSVCIAKAGTINKIPQSSWNGRGLWAEEAVNTAQNLTVDWDLSQFFVIEFGWLGVGSVRFSILVDGVPYEIHTEAHSNVTDGTYMISPNHSVRYEIRSTGGTKSMKQICCAVESIGGKDPSGEPVSVDSGTTAVTNSGLGSNTVAVGIRLKATSLCTTVMINGLSVMASTNATYRYQLVMNPTVAGTPLVWTGITNSALESAPGITDNTITGGEVLYTGFNTSDTDAVTIPVNVRRTLGAAIDGTRDEIFLVTEKLLAGNEDFYGAINVTELTCG